MRPLRGISLIETMLSFAILAVVIGMGWFLSVPSLQRQQVRAAADVVVTELRQAQMDSFAQTENASHGIAIFSDRVVRFQGASYAARDATKDQIFAFPTPITVSSAEVVFLPGTLRPTTATVITLEHGQTAVDIFVSSYGTFEVTQRTITS